MDALDGVLGNAGAERVPVPVVTVQSAAYAALNRGADPAAIEAALGDRDPKDIPADEAAGVVEKLAALGGGQ